MPQTPELLLIMPVYNEQDSIQKVISEWQQELPKWTQNFSMLAINDGSTDGTWNILQSLQETFGERLEVMTRENRGHGQTCIQGYRIACDRSIPFVFQIDSDGQCDPRYFGQFWRERENYDVIYGKRVKREDGWRRDIASKILRLCLMMWSGANCPDPNVPYRLMRTAAIRDSLAKINADFYLANIALAVVLRNNPNIRQGVIPIGFRQRHGGKSSIPIRKFGAKALELRKQLKQL